MIFENIEKAFLPTSRLSVLFKATKNKIEGSAEKNLYKFKSYLRRLTTFKSLKPNNLPAEPSKIRGGIINLAHWRQIFILSENQYEYADCQVRIYEFWQSVTNYKVIRNRNRKFVYSYVGFGYIRIDS